MTAPGGLAIIGFMRAFFPITRKINLLIVISLMLGIGVIIVYFAYTQNLSVREMNRDRLEQQSNILYQSIENIMLPGEALIAVQFLTDVKDTDPTLEIILYRSDGEEAFSDNETIDKVNANLGYEVFPPKTLFQENRMIVRGDDRFNEAVAKRKNVLFQKVVDGRTFSIIYKPLLNLPKCAGCHGSDHTVRGVISITVDITATVSQQRTNLVIAVAFFVVIVVLLAFILAQFLQGTVIRPVKHIGDVCVAVTQGDFSAHVQVRNNDEIGALGSTVNQMVEGLYERFELSKFVSPSTLQSIKDRKEGTRAEMTLFFSDIRRFTSFSENLEPEQVVGALNRILNVQTNIIHSSDGDVDKYVGDEVVAIFSGEDKENRACRAALKIQHELAKNSEHYSGLKVGIGLNTGEVILGLLGSEKRADFTAIGDHVNVASRLCGVAKSGQVIISDSTFRKVERTARSKGPFRVKVKGKEHYQKVHILLAMKEGS